MDPVALCRVAVTVLGITAGVIPGTRSFALAGTQPPFVPTMDPRGPYVLAITEAAAKRYTNAIAEARKLHPEASEVVFPAGDFQPVETLLRKQHPRYAMVFLMPEELDVNFAWNWLRVVTQVDADPLVDVRTGFITGRDPGAAAQFVRRIRAAVENKTPMPGAMVDNLGPNLMAPKEAFFRNPGNFMIPVLEKRLGLTTISHGTNAFNSERLGSLDAAGVVHFGGHGYPERIVEGVTAAQARQLKLAPCVVFNGACYTGVTGRWYDFRDKIFARQVAVEDCFCLAMLDNNVLGYLAALSPDHGIPVYQEMEFLATDGASLGDIIKHTHDGVIVAHGGKLPAFELFRDGMARPQWTPADFMLKGTASRVLFGDPALLLTRAFTEPAFEVKLRPDGTNTCRATATLKNTNLKSTFTDTYFSDLSSVPNLFNDRALLTCRVPEGWNGVKQIEVLEVKANGTSIKGRLQGFAVEEDAGRRLLHVQIDLPTKGYMQSDFRAPGATVELRLLRTESR